MYTKESVIKDWLAHDASVQKFNVLVDRRRLSPSTRYGYMKNVKRFVDYFGAKSPAEALEKLKVLSVAERTDVIDGFVSKLLADNMNTTTVVQLIRGGFKKWLQLNEVEINWIKVQGEILPGEEPLVSDRMPTKPELKQILNTGGLRDRTMLLVLTSSGLRVGTLATLTLGDISLNEEIPRVVVKRAPGRKVSRKMKGFATFITPEAKAVLEQYIKFRMNATDEKGNPKGEKITDASPVLTSDRIDELGHFLNSTYVSNHWRRLLKRAHLATKNGGPGMTSTCIHLENILKPNVPMPV